MIRKPGTADLFGVRKPGTVEVFSLCKPGTVEVEVFGLCKPGTGSQFRRLCEIGACPKVCPVDKAS